MTEITCIVAIAAFAYALFKNAWSTSQEAVDWGFMMGKDALPLRSVLFRRILPPIVDEKSFVKACRRLLRQRGIDIPDGRIIAQGYRHFSPSSWAKPMDGEEFSRVEKFLAWLQVAMVRPSILGSEANLPIDQYYWLWRSKISARSVLGLTRWGQKFGPRRLGAPLTPRSHEELRLAAKAAMRGSLRYQNRSRAFCLKALALLGGLSASKQARIVHSIFKDGVPTVAGLPAGEISYAYGTLIVPQLRVRDIMSHLKARTPSIDAVIAIYDHEFDTRHWDTEELLFRINRRLAAIGSPNLADAIRYPQWPQMDIHLAFFLRRNGGAKATWPTLSKAELAIVTSKATKPADVMRWQPILIKASLQDTVLKVGGYRKGSLPRYVEDIAFRLEAAPIEVIRWAIAIGKDGRFSALYKEREAHGPAGEHQRFILLSRLDEITPADLPQGPKTPVVRAFELASERLAALITECNGEVLCTPPEVTLPKGFTWLVTQGQLNAESEAMDHCVKTYGQSIKAGRCLILSIVTEAGRSTAELCISLTYVYQHMGKNNTAPHPINEAALKAWLQDVRNSRLGS